MSGEKQTPSEGLDGSFDVEALRLIVLWHGHFGRALSELTDQLVLALESSKCHGANLLGLVPRPLLGVERVVEVDEIITSDKVDERVPNIGMCRQIHGQVKKVKPPFKGRNILQQGFAHIAIWNVANHHSRTLFCPFTNGINIDGKLGRCFG